MSLYGEDYRIQSLARGLAVIRSFGPGKERQTIAEVATACQLTRAGARRILITLQDLGYVALDGRQHFLTSKVLDLADLFLEQPRWQIARPILQDLVDTLNETASIGMLDGHDVVFPLRIRSPRPLHLEDAAGRLVSAHASPVGRVLLAAMTPSQLQRYLQRVELVRYTPSTVCDRERLCELLDQARAQGWCHVRGESDEGASGVAVPLKDGQDRTVAALSIESTSERMSPEHVERTVAPALKKAAEIIEKAF